jgi:hypothetical protein
LDHGGSIWFRIQGLEYPVLGMADEFVKYHQTEKNFHHEDHEEYEAVIFLFLFFMLFMVFMFFVFFVFFVVNGHTF